ncbi:hypothetical protein FALCPG4_000174 [Fusarium falciforme]
MSNLNTSDSVPPPPRPIRFVHNQGQPPSKRRRINAAYVVPWSPILASSPDLPAAYLSRHYWCLFGRLVIVLLSHPWTRRLKPCQLVADSDANQVFDLPKTKDEMRRRKTLLLYLHQESPPMSGIS